LNGRIRRNVMDTRRALSFMMRSRMLNAEQFEEARQILRDIDSLDSHTAFLFDKINFLMDATVGFININQNKIIKIFSVASVALLPPTLIASIYGMNFKAHARAGLEPGLPVRAGADGGVGGGAVHLLQAQGLAGIDQVLARRFSQRISAADQRQLLVQLLGRVPVVAVHRDAAVGREAQVRAAADALLVAREARMRKRKSQVRKHWSPCTTTSRITKRGRRAR
jgi:hypothetical protein